MIRGKLEGPRESLKYEKARTVCLYLKLTHWSVAHSWLPLVWIPLSFCSCRVSMLFYHQDLGTIFLQTSLNLISQFVNLTIEPTNCLYCKKKSQRLFLQGKYSHDVVPLWNDHPKFDLKLTNLVSRNNTSDLDIHLFTTIVHKWNSSLILWLKYICIYANISAYQLTMIKC